MASARTLRSKATVVPSILRRRNRFAYVSKMAVRYAVEALEDRTLLSSFVVTNVNDSGPGSLRDAITQANNNPGPDIITFNIPGTGVQTISPTSALPPII